MTDDDNDGKRRSWKLPVAAVLLVAVAGALVLFQPWKLFVDVVVDEANPIAPAVAASGSPAGGEAPASTSGVRGGTFRSIAHTTSGKATVGPVAGGGHAVYIEDLATDNGPDVKVYLSTVPADGDAATFARDGLLLADLKGNVGNQSYAIPAGTDLGKYRSVVLWCERFSVGFGVAPLDPV
jgi:hypothetical protein